MDFDHGTKLNSSLVVDEADTLEGQAEDAAEFFTLYAPLIGPLCVGTRRHSLSSVTRN